MRLLAYLYLMINRVKNLCKEAGLFAIVSVAVFIMLYIAIGLLHELALFLLRF